MSRICRALASPYFFKPFRCEFGELIRSDGRRHPPAVTLNTKDNFKTLKLHQEIEPYLEPGKQMTITQVLSVQHTYECLEYLPGSAFGHFNLSVPALDILNRFLPSLSKLVLGLGEFKGYSPSWDHTHKKVRGTVYPDPPAPLAYVDGLDLICAIARFENISRLTLHYYLQHDQVALMHPIPGCEAVCELFQSIQSRKRGKPLVHLDVVFYTSLVNIFGRVDPWWYSGWSDGPAAVTISCSNDTSSRVDQHPQYTCTCDNLLYGKVIERRKRIERVYGYPAWSYRLGSVQWKLVYGSYRAFPWNIVMESLMWLMLLPSSFVFDEVKRAQYELLLVDATVSCRKDYSKRRTRFKERLFSIILLC